MGFRFIQLVKIVEVYTQMYLKAEVVCSLFASWLDTIPAQCGNCWPIELRPNTDSYFKGIPISAEVCVSINSQMGFTQRSLSKDGSCGYVDRQRPEASCHTSTVDRLTGTVDLWFHNLFLPKHILIKSPLHVILMTGSCRGRPSCICVWHLFFRDYHTDLVPTLMGFILAHSTL